MSAGNPVPTYGDCVTWHKQMGLSFQCGHPAHTRREVVMEDIHWIIAAAVLAFVEPAQAGVNDPEVIIYRGSGVLDTGGGSFTGNATAIHCTNFSGVTETI